jgi:hypothetical protein
LEIRYETDGDLRKREENKQRALKIEAQYCYEMDLKILKYVETGFLESTSDLLAPRFAGRLEWLGERLQPSIAALDEVEQWDFPNARLRDVDIFGEELNENDPEIDAFRLKQVLKDPFLFEESDESIDDSELAKTSWTDARAALSARDDYYDSLHHEGWDGLFDEPYSTLWHGIPDYGGWEEEYREAAFGGNYDEDESNTEDDEEDGNDSYLTGATQQGRRANIHYGEHEMEDPWRVTAVEMAIDWIVAQPSAAHPIPLLIPDTQSAEPAFPPPRWYHAVEQSYMKELSQLFNLYFET